MNEPFGRRSLLRQAGFSVGAGTLATVIVAGDAHAVGDLTGSWLIDRQNDSDPTPTRGIFSFADGAVVVYQDLFPAGPVALGTWERDAHGGLRATFWAAYPARTADDVDITARVQMTGTINGRTLTGSYEAVFFYQATDQDVLTAQGTLHGTRVRSRS